MQDVNASGQIGAHIIEKSEENTIVDLLNSLIAANRGMADVYQTVVNRLENKANAALLQGYAEQHKTFTTKLSNVIVGYSGKPATSGEGRSLFKQAWITLKSAVTQGDDAIWEELVQDAAAIVQTYRDVLDHDLPESVREMVQGQMNELHDAYQKLVALT